MQIVADGTHSSGSSQRDVAQALPSQMRKAHCGLAFGCAIVQEALNYKNDYLSVLDCTMYRRRYC